MFENSGVAVITDLPIIRACQLITDAVNITEGDPVYEVAHAVPTAGTGTLNFIVSADTVTILTLDYHHSCNESR